MRVLISARPKHAARSLSLLRWSRNILFITAIVALGYYGYVWADARIFEANQARQFERATKQFTSDTPSINIPSPELPAAVSEVEGTSTSVAGFDAPGVLGSVLGRIEIKKIGLAVLVLEGNDNRSLRRAVGHIPHTALPGQPGNVGIAGHRDTYFRGLRNIAKNDQITLTTVRGSYNYVVDFSEVVEPNDMDVLDPSSDAILTLVTCYPFWHVGPAPKRLIVRAHLTPE